MAKKARTWDIIYNISSFNTPLITKYNELSPRESKIQELYTQTDQSKRKNIYSEICQKDENTFKETEIFLNKVQNHSQKFGFKDVMHWVLDEEVDPIDWNNLFKNQNYKVAIANYAQNNVTYRKNILGLENYHFWDHWYLEDSNKDISIYTKIFKDTFESSLSFIKSFYDQLGLLKIYENIDFIKKENTATYALIHEDNGLWINEIYISERGTGCKMGSIQYLSTLAHETGHIVQSRHIKSPKDHFFMAPNPLNETLSMFFEYLILTKPFISQFDIGQQTLINLLKQIKIENTQKIIRILEFLEFETEIYQIHQSKNLTSSVMSETYKKIRKAYYGFENNTLEDHTWMRGLFYLAYSPFKQRSYVIGYLLSNILIDQFLSTISNNQVTNASKDFLNQVIINCSDKGSFNTWEDYQNACNLTSPIDTDFIINGITKALSPSII
ncbi:hypothetical protein BVY03_01755 [bacterium K02(2017)]|nr:hypothetical protein BVY03_01755 [bacterium K02(2017)]